MAVDRLVRFRGMAEADARARIGRQVSREERLAKADRVIDNAGGPDALPAQVDDLWTWLRTLPAATEEDLAPMVKAVADADAGSAPHRPAGPEERSA